MRNDGDSTRFQQSTGHGPGQNEARQHETAEGNPRSMFGARGGDGQRVAILVADDFEESEMTEPRGALEQAGIRTTLIAPQTGEVHAMHHDERAGAYPVDQLLAEADPDDFDGLLLPGGAINADQLRINPDAQEFVRRINDAHKPIAVICHAPWLLVSSGLVRGRSLTSWHTIQDDIRNAGGNWLDREVVRDDNLVTSRGPKDIPSFNREMIELLTQRSQQRAA